MFLLNAKKEYAFKQVVGEVMHHYDAPGVAVAIVDKDQTLYRNFFGFRDKENQLPINEDTIFGVASITKSFTSLSIMQLAEKGILDVSHSVSTYIPELTDDTVTISHLLCHSGGYYPLPRILAEDVAKGLGIFPDGDGDLAYSEKLAEAGVKLVAERLNAQEKRIGKSGAYLSYCNDGYGLLSEIVHRYGGCSSYGEYVKENILKPLGMERSTPEFLSVMEDGNTSNLHIHRNGKLSTEKNFYDNAFVLMGGGAMKSTIKDLERYVQMYMNGGLSKGGQSLLSPDGILEMGKPRQYYRHQQYYGYGLSTNHIGQVTTIGHGGSLTGVSSQFIWSPELGIGVVVLCNTSGVPTSLIADEAMKWAAGYSVGTTSTPEPQQWSEEMILSATGDYVSGEGTTITVTPDGEGISIAISGEVFPTVTILPKVALMHINMVNSPIEFMVDNFGKVWAVRYGGRIIPKA